MYAPVPPPSRGRDPGGPPRCPRGRRTTGPSASSRIPPGTRSSSARRHRTPEVMRLNLVIHLIQPDRRPEDEQLLRVLPQTHCLLEQVELPKLVPPLDVVHV